MDCPELQDRYDTAAEEAQEATTGIKYDLEKLMELVAEEMEARC